MKLILLLLFLMTTNFSSLYSASNDDPIFYDEIGGWEIGILPYLNFGCYTSSPVYEGGEMLSVYVDNRQNAKNVYLHLKNKKFVLYSTLIFTVVSWFGGLIILLFLVQNYTVYELSLIHI